MAQSATLQITLTPEDLDFVQRKVATGEFASAEDFVVDSIRSVMDQDEERRQWEQKVLIPAHDQLMAHPSTAIPIDEVERNLELRRQQRRQAS